MGCIRVRDAARTIAAIGVATTRARRLDGGCTGQRQREFRQLQGAGVRGCAWARVDLGLAGLVVSVAGDERKAVQAERA